MQVIFCTIFKILGELNIGRSLRSKQVSRLKNLYKSTFILSINDIVASTRIKLTYNMAITE